MGVPTITISLLILFANLGVAQSQEPPKSWVNVVRAGRVGKEVVITTQLDGFQDKVWLVYLGKLRSDGGHIYKFLSMSSVTGRSMRGHGMLLIFDEKNRYLGKYNWGAIKEHGQIANGVVLIPVDPGCVPSNTYTLSVKKGLPKQFFFECKDGMGDIYTFEDRPW
jgi:hypothetical protein